MIGGEREAFEACRPLFRVLAEKFFYIGPSGSGSKAKLASNLILGLNRLVLAEGSSLRKNWGSISQRFWSWSKRLRPIRGLWM